MFFLLFLKVFPIIAISEVKELEIHARDQARAQAQGGAH
jgi:hypothetical protein